MNATNAPIVVDTSILFSALLSDSSPFVEIIFRSDYNFYICEYVIVELFKHNDRLIKYSKLSSDDLLRLLYRLLKHLHVYPERLLDPEKLAQAATLCASVDAKDTVHVALTLTIGGLLWTGDKSLREGLRKQGFDKFFVPAIA